MEEQLVERVYEPFSHLHNHTDFSLLDGAAPIERYMAKAKELNMHSLAITDHGNMFGALRFYFAAKDAGINPIIGCEFYVNPTSRWEKTMVGGRSPTNTISSFLR